MNMRFAGALCVLASMTPVAARAQQLPAPASAEAPTSEPPAAPLPVAAQPAAIPALTPVSVEILADLGSNTSVSGARFPIRLAAPLVVDGVAVVPAGATGEGEVVHAKKSSGMGAAGELVLAARYVEFEGRQIRLRSLKLTFVGKSAIKTVNTLNVASAASPLPIGMVGFFLFGGKVTVAQGTIAEAKTAEEFPLTKPAPEGAANQQQEIAQ